MKVSAEVEIACSLAAREAQRRGHDVLTVEHLLFALLHDEETSKIVRKSGGNVAKIKADLEKVMDEFIAHAPEGVEVTPTQSRGFNRVIQRAAIHVESSGKEELKGYNVLVAIFAELDSHAVKVLNDAGVTRYDVVNFVSHGVAKDGEDELSETPGGASETEEEEASNGEQDALARFAVNLNERAKAGDIEPLVGRDKEVRRAIQVLSRAAARTTRSSSVTPAWARRRSWRGSQRTSRRARCRSRSSRPSSTRSTWARSSPARSFAVTSRTA